MLLKTERQREIVKSICIEYSKFKQDSASVY